MQQNWICPNCGAAMKEMQDTSGIYRICEKCGCTIQGEAQQFDITATCPNCHQEMQDTHECVHCGYDLGTDFD